MSEIKLVSPMLDNFNIGDPISDRNGIRCCPAMKNDSDERFIVKVISIPASQVQYDALLLTGVCTDRESAMAYFNDLANGVVDEIQALEKLSALEGFLPADDYQIVPMEDDVGYDIYLLTKYRKTLAKQLQKQSLTHLGAVNLGLDLCAALSVSRKFGYLYVDLKPSNVYLFGEQSYRIGDVGFIKLDSLKYASLPEAYRSAYTAPEIADAFSALNTTMDTYALGHILYQVFSGGALPVANSETGAIDPPAYADPEMSEIILKACALNPEDRWQDPIDMGQALVAYLQRNSVNDTRIVPITEIAPEEAPEVPADETTEELPCESVETTDDTADLTNLSFLDDEEDTAAEETADIAYAEVTDEVSDILAAVDQLIAEPVLEPETSAESEDTVADADEAIVSDETIADNDVTEIIPDTEIEEIIEDIYDETESLLDEDDVTVVLPPVPTEESEEISDEVVEDTPQQAEATEETETSEETEEDAPAEDIPCDDDAEEDPAPEKKKFAWWKGLIIALLLAGIAVAGYFYYTLCYLQPVSMALNGADNKLTVTVDCAIDGLYVTCIDANGNQHKADVSNGVAEFNALEPNTAYTVSVETDKFHKLTGNTTTTYLTDVQTKIMQFTAVNGAEAGDVILTFIVEGPVSEEWCLYYGPTGEETETLIFSGNNISLTGLNIDTQYTFALEPVADIFFDTNNAITFTPTVPVQATGLYVSSFTENSLTVTWSEPTIGNIYKWIVQCSDGVSYNETVETSGLSATFNGIDAKNTYTIKVLAEGMSVGAEITASEGFIYLSNFEAVPEAGMITLTWNSSVENSSWIVSYGINNTAIKELSVSGNSQCQVPYIPNATYVFTVKSADDSEMMNNQYTFTTESAETFNNYGLGAEHIGFLVYEAPKKSNWTYRDLIYASTTSRFKANGKAAFLLSTPFAYEKPADTVMITYVTYDANGNYLDCAVESAIWNTMWVNGYAVLRVPSLPSVSGSYTVAVYLNGTYLNHANLTITG